MTEEDEEEEEDRDDPEPEAGALPPHSKIRVMVMLHFLPGITPKRQSGEVDLCEPMTVSPQLRLPQTLPESSLLQATGCNLQKNRKQGSSVSR